MIDQTASVFLFLSFLSFYSILPVQINNRKLASGTILLVKNIWELVLRDHRRIVINTYGNQRHEPVQNQLSFAREKIKVDQRHR
jgi:hypothetical protein